MEKGEAGAVAKVCTTSSEMVHRLSGDAGALSPESCESGLSRGPTEGDSETAVARKRTSTVAPEDALAIMWWRICEETAMVSLGLLERPLRHED